MNRLCALGAMLALAASAAESESHPTLPLGSQAPDFRLPGVDGKYHSLKDFRKAAVLVIVFTCNHCPTAQYYEERLKQVAADYSRKGVALVAINPNNPGSVRLDELGYTDLSDSLAEMKIRARHKAFNFPYLYDGEHQAVSRAYGPVATPHAFVFDRQRRLRYSGRVDDSERPSLARTRDLRDAIEAVLEGREVASPQTRSFGCSIKWAGKEDSVRQYMAGLANEPVTVETVDAGGLKTLRAEPSGKVRLVNFWATWCGPCVTEFPELVTMNRMYRHRAFELVTVAANYPDEKKDVLAFLKKREASSRNLLFGETDKYKLIEAFDPKWDGGLPYTVLLGPQAEVLYRCQGPFDALELKRAIVKALKEDRFK